MTPNHPLPRILSSIALALSMAASPVDAESAASTRPALPDTPAARLMSDWMTLCDQPDRARMTSWFDAQLSSGGRGRMTPAARAADMFELCSANGGLDTVAVAKSDPLSITLTTRGRKSGAWFEIILMANEAGEFDRGGMMPTVPVESALPARIDDAVIARELEQSVARLSSSGLFSGIVVVARGERIMAQASGGYANRAEKTPFDTSSGFTLIRSAFVPATPAPIIEAATSPDGSAWTLDTADAIPAFDWVGDLTILDDHPVTIGGRSDGTTTVLRREDTGAWTTIEPAKLLRGLASESETGVPVYYYSSASESGIALLYGAGGEPPEESEDAGYRLQVDTSGNAVVSDRSGAEVGRLALVDGSAVQGALRYDATKNTVQVLDTDGRTPLATLPVRAWQDTPRLRYLVWSPDGQRWGVEDLDAVTDGELSPNGVSMEAGRITIPLDGTTDDGTTVTAPGAPRRALVADLPR